ncbi:C45 family autoproteolytic acyltransferase/hydolase [Vitiosangium sp. GDMCC 1.1324]|uniref:C45 family autoproteolytic acyltransferase/hydolase n=1 Tax=Vitiosangium sp. (strain GDMCC 1.1324) TaxID=2138576 RepID=UPI001E5C5A90|nr:C45 family autoproteolytic acyltransferase/hydolase [Vitiosangium sp. GDMCC 1.1324]
MTSRILGALLFTAGALHASPSRAAQVPVSNAGFESLVSSGQPSGWTATGGGRVASSPDGKSEGARGLVIENPVGGAETTVQSEPVKLQVGRLYRLSAWVRTRGVQADAQARYPTAIGACLSMKSFPFTNCSPTQGADQDGRVSVLFFAIQGSDRVQVHLGRNGKATGSAWVDDVRLEEVDDITAYIPMESVRWAGKGFRYDDGGWKYIHIEGEPYERGQQYGELVAEDVVRYMEKVGIQKNRQDAVNGWSQVRLLADSLFLRKYEPEFLEEMKGIADGVNKAGVKFKDREVELLDVVALNSVVDLGQLEDANRVSATPISGRVFLKAEDETARAGEGDHCSSFVATKSATRDGQFIMGQLFMWNGYTGVHWDVMLDVQPTRGHRFIMQTFPGGIHSGADWFINDAGIVIGETTVGQTPFDPDGTPQSNRIRKAAQYASTIEDVARILKERNNGLYTNDWTLADAKSGEGACLTLGTKKTKLWRTGGKGNGSDTPGNLKDFIWANNNNRDLEVRKEYIPNPQNAPVDLAFNTWNRDIAFQKYFEQYGKGGIDLENAIRMMASSPINRPHACDGKITTGEMASQLMFLAHYGKTTLREKMVGGRWIQDLPGATAHLTLGYTTFSPIFVADKLKAARAKSLAAEAKDSTPKRDTSKVKESLGFDKKLLWANTVFPATDGENWLVSGTSAYWNVLNKLPDSADKAFDQQRDALAELNTRYLYLASREGDVVPVATRTSYGRYGTYAIPRIKGTFLLHQLRLLLGNKSFSKVMSTVHERYANKNITTADFVRTASEAAGRDLKPFISQWVDRGGLPEPRILASSTKAKDGYDVTLKVEQGDKPYHLVTSVELVSAKGSTLERVEVKSASEAFSFHVAEQPVRVVFNPANDIPVPRERFQVLSNVMDDFSQLLFVHGTARGVEADRTLTLNFREVVADAFTDQLAPLKPDSEVTEQELASKDLFVLGGAEDNGLVARLAAEKKLPVEIGRRFFRWQGKTYGRSDDGLAVALPNPWNPKRALYLYLANSGPQLWHMTRAFQPGQLQGWAIYRGGEVSTKGYHGLDALAVELKESPAPEVKPISSAASAN